MHFSLIDRITELTPGKSISAIKNLSLAEEYLADHFPGFPVMPGVLMIEALVQTGAWLMRETDDFRCSTILLKRARAVRFNSFLQPGHTLALNVTVHESGPEAWTIKGRGTIDGESAVNARLVLEQFNLSDRNPELAESDAARVEWLRTKFRQLWRAPAA